MVGEGMAIKDMANLDMVSKEGTEMEGTVAMEDTGEEVADTTRVTDILGTGMATMEEDTVDIREDKIVQTSGT
eukprot:m.338921 g.338921  ORF g.338921 m.338921 type:complete len:73 (+) comp18594_c0_seq1:1391-1609(+)